MSNGIGLTLQVPSIITYIGYSRKFILDTDASLSGIGAVLPQCQDEGRDQVCYCFMPAGL